MSQLASSAPPARPVQSDAPSRRLLACRWPRSLVSSPVVQPLTLGLVLFACLAGWGAARDSQTWDEAMSMAAGYRQSDLGDYSVLWENPPLLGWIVYVPFKLAGVEHPEFQAGSVGAVSPVQYGWLFLYGAANPHRRVLLLARLAVLVVSLVAVAAVIWWAWRLHGPQGAWIAALCAGCEPSWLAHGRTSAFDGVATAMITLALLGCAQLLERPTWRRASMAGVALGLALASKHTALLLLPLVTVLGTLATVPRSRRWLAAVQPDPPLPWIQVAARWVAVVLAGFVVLGATYGLTFDYGRYLHSLGGTYRLGSAGYLNYLLGTFREEPFPHYYLVAAAVKTPVGFLLLLPLGLFATLASRLRSSWLPAVLWIALMVVVTALNPHNIGYRHFLPAIPALLLVSAGAPDALASRGLGGVALLLALGGAAESLVQAPQHLAFFNFAAGGPDRGIECLDDSSIDWGQDLVRLAELQRTEQIQELALRYFGSAAPAAYGVQARLMGDGEFEHPRRGTTYAISVQVLNGQPRAPGLDWLHTRTVWRKAGRSIYLYRF